MSIAEALELSAVESHLHPEGSFDLADHDVPTGLEEIWRFTPLKRLRGLHTDTPLDGDDFKVGELFETAAITLTEAHIVTWAGLTGDFYPLHMDREYAAKTQFGERLVHGPLIFGLAVGLVSLAGIGGEAAIAWLGVDDMRMLKPVKLGDTVRVIVEVRGQQSTSNPRRGVQVWRYTVRNQRDEEVMAFDYKMMFHMRG